MEDRGTRAKGLAIVSLGVLLITPDTLLVRLAAMEPWSLLVWRSFLVALGLFLLIALIWRRRAPAAILSIGRTGGVITLFYAAVNVLFVLALANTTVANVLIIVSAAPFFAALTSRIFLGEAIAGHTWIAILAALGGIAILTSDNLGSGALLGDLLALACAIMFGCKFTLVRHAREINMIPAAALSGLVSGGIALAAGPVVVLPSQDQLAVLVIMALVLLPVGIALMTIGPRYLPAPEVSLLILLEAVLGPIWVWLVIGEEPSRAALLGGAIVVSTLAVHSLLVLKRESGTLTQTAKEKA
ncbi:MAG: DMT family transporter [Kiloniellales bacterium]|nr:DMT family transporter [Kiloniellales bacterium]